MKDILIQLLAVNLLFMSASVSATGYIDATDDFPFTKVEGDGTEAGFVAEIELETRNSEVYPAVDIPKENNLAGCELKTLEVLSSAKIGQGEWLHVIYVKIDTEVFADTGSCTVYIKDRDTIYEIIKYMYVTDY